MNNLVLYIRNTCPYCQKVLRFLAENKINVEQKDISDNDELVQELINIGGKKQVPCLVVNDKALYESDDIIEWFKKKS